MIILDKINRDVFEGLFYVWFFFCCFKLIYQSYFYKNVDNFYDFGYDILFNYKYCLYVYEF